jgi:hypothetical protein
MPENKPGFIQVKDWIIEAAAEQGVRMSVRRAKGLAGDYLTKDSPDDYFRLTYSDPIGEGVARRWAEFAHNLERTAAPAI